MIVFDISGMNKMYSVINLELMKIEMLKSGHSTPHEVWKVVSKKKAKEKKSCSRTTRDKWLGKSRKEAKCSKCANVQKKHYLSLYKWLEKCTYYVRPEKGQTSDEDRKLVLSFIKGRI